jgi:large subunit ribosomal protein L15
VVKQAVKAVLTKGNKGGQSRAGYKSKKAHEGGQMPIQRRIPKRGFTNINRIEYQSDQPGSD